MLAPHLWPDDIVDSVKAIQVGPHGLKVTFVDPLQARRTILEQTGRFKSVAAPIDELAAAVEYQDSSYAPAPSK